MDLEFLRKHINDPIKPLSAHIECADGFRMSVQASRFHYCIPRDDFGPYSEMEVGFPSQVVEALLPYAEDSDNPTGTVYGYVPVEIIDQVISQHGGIATKGLCVKGKKNGKR